MVLKLTEIKEVRRQMAWHSVATAIGTPGAATYMYAFYLHSIPQTDSINELRTGHPIFPLLPDLICVKLFRSAKTAKPLFKA